MPIVLKTDNFERRVENRNDRFLSFIIQQAGIPLDLQCSGLGICRKCRVELGPGAYLVSDRRVDVAKGESLPALACQTKVTGENAEVRIPKSAILKTEGKIYDDFETGEFNFNPLTRKLHIRIEDATLENPRSDWDRMLGEIRKVIDIKELSCCLHILQKLPEILRETKDITVTVGRFQHEWHLIDIDPGDHSGDNLGAAVDIGTTTVVVILVDMKNGKILSKASAYNQQMSRADDVASRISAASSGPDQLKYMKDLVVNDTINPLLKAACSKAGRDIDDIQRLAVSGNTVMSHLFLGLSPRSIGVIPFQPVTNIYADSLGAELDLSMHGCGVVNIVPSIGGYIGGDITSDIYVTGIHEKQGLSAIIDLGTNSEMVLADNGKLFACAAAAGPAFEGAGLLCGCRATSGAIEHVCYDDRLDFDLDIIDGMKAIGICGSAIIDFIACGFRCGLINGMGRFNVEMLKARGAYTSIDGENGRIHCCVLVRGELSDSGAPVIVSEMDLEQILKAKAAVYAGLKTMLSQRGCGFTDLEKIYLAGGFAKYINIDNAVCIGMLPELPPGIIEGIGNGSLAGAYLSLLDPAAREAFFRIIEIPENVPLNMVPEFEMNFVDALMLPNFNESEFPSAMKQLTVK